VIEAFLMAVVAYLAILAWFGVGKLRWLGMLAYIFAASLHFPDIKNRKAWKRIALLFLGLLILQIAIIAAVMGVLGWGIGR